jgi:hypothetical protein
MNQKQMATSTDRLAEEALASLLEPDGAEPAIPFGDWLVRRGLINRKQLFNALNLSYRIGFRIGDALVALKVLSRHQVEDEAQRHTVFRAFAGAL